jgi:Ca-activated chloride channel family protein
LAGYPEKTINELSVSQLEIFDMVIMWPGLLILLGLIPLLLVGYVWQLRRRRRFTVRYSNLAMVREALQGHSHKRRHLPFALFLLAVASLVMAMGRPMVKTVVPEGQATVILAMDVSRSMCTTDIEPNRLEAAKEAAASFIQRHRSGNHIGLVAFAGFAELVQPPSTDEELLLDAIERLRTGRMTAIGSAILRSIDAIAEVNQAITGSGLESQPNTLNHGEYSPDIIVLLTDGANNTGAQPIQAAQVALERGIRVYTIGFGTEFGAPMDCGDGFGAGGFFGGGGSGNFRRGIDEPTLQQIAALTGGEYYSATSAGELQEVFRSLPSYLVTRTETTEISFAFAALAALLVVLATGLNMIWHPWPV